MVYPSLIQVLRRALHKLVYSCPLPGDFFAFCLKVCLGQFIFLFYLFFYLHVKMKDVIVLKL